MASRKVGGCFFFEFSYRILVRGRVMFRRFRIRSINERIFGKISL